jgi:hypothetical protein
VGTLARCHDCDHWLNPGGWIVTNNYPATDTVVGILDKVLICDRCLVARSPRGTTGTAPAISDTSVVLAVRVRGIPRILRGVVVLLKRMPPSSSCAAP